jgi:hypothetical protein
MKPLRAIGVTALMAAALLVLIAAGSASATVLCTNSSCTAVYASGTKVSYTLKSGASSTLKNTSGETLDKCTESTVSGKTSSESGTKISSSLESLTWGGCSQTTDTVKNGSFSITWTSGSNGSVSGSENQVTVVVFGVTCTYGTTAEGTTLGTLTGGETPVLAISAVVSKTAGSFLCPSTGKWAAEYVVTEPHALFVGKEKGSEPTSTSLTTSLSGESKSGEEITVNEGSKVKDTATLSGTNASKATGTAKYKVYADKECKELVTSAGEVTVTGGSVPASEEKELEAGRVYYWQAEYSGDSNNLASTSTCGKEVLTVKAKTTLTTTLRGEPWYEEPVEGEKITLPQGVSAVDTTTLGGTKSSAATGTVKYKVYKDKECKELITEAGEVSVKEGSAGPSEEIELEEGAYYWQASYEGDSLHQASTSTCGSEVLTIESAITLSSALTVGEETGEEIEVEAESAVVTETETLSGPKASTANGKVIYKFYADLECEELVAEAGEVTVSEGKVPASEPITLEPGLYFGQAHYTGDAVNGPDTTECGETMVQVDPNAVTLHETEVGGAALALKSKVEGSGPNLFFQSENGSIIECKENLFVGEVQKNGKGAAVVKLTSWEFKGGGVEAGTCKTTVKINNEFVDAVITPVELGTLRLSGELTGRLERFEIKLELYFKKSRELTCRFGVDAAWLKFAFNEAMGLNVYAVAPQMTKRLGSEPKCGRMLATVGLFTVTTPKPAANAIFPTNP